MPLKQGLIQIYTGDGKGKSTAAFGLAARAAGRNLKVVIIQFMKTDKGYGEQITMKKLAPQVELYCYGTGKWLHKGKANDEEIAKANAALVHSAKAMQDANVDMVIMDEVNNAIYFELLTVGQVLTALHNKASHVEVVLTGRNAPPELVKEADLVTEMLEIKHPYQQGINSREGIEF